MRLETGLTGATVRITLRGMQSKWFRFMFLVCCVLLRPGGESVLAQSDDGDWVYYDHNPGFSFFDEDAEADRGRSRIRDDGTGGSDWSQPADQGFSPRGVYSPPAPTPPVSTERRSRNWILPTLEGDSPAWSETNEEDEASGWGWLADDLQGRRQSEAANVEERLSRQEQMEFQQNLRRESDIGGDFSALALPLLGTGTGPASPINQVGVNAQDLDRVADMSPDELADWATRQAGGMDPDLAYAPADPWDTQSMQGSPWGTMAAPVDSWSSSAQETTSFSEAGGGFGPASFSADASRWNAGTAPSDASRIGSGSGRIGRLDRTGEASSFDAGWGRADSSTAVGSGNYGDMGYQPAGWSGAGWGGDWSGAADWQPGSATATPSPTSGSGGDLLTTPETAFPGIGDGWLADR
jgi:hypothetical protein